MWRRMGEVVEKLARADGARLAVLWQNLTQGDGLNQACHAAVAAGPLAEDVLTRCHTCLSENGVRERLAAVVGEQEDEPTVEEARQTFAAALVALLARRCAAGEDQAQALLS